MGRLVDFDETRRMDEAVTPGYMDFLNKGEGEGVELSVSWRDEEGISRRLTAFCEKSEVDEVVMDIAGHVADGNSEDTEFMSSVREISDLIADSLANGEPFDEIFGDTDARFTGRGLTHPIKTAHSFLQDGRFVLITQACQEQPNTPCIRVNIDAGGRAWDFKCLPLEAAPILEFRLDDMAARLGIGIDKEAVKQFILESGGKASAEFDGVRVSVIDNGAPKAASLESEGYLDFMHGFSEAVDDAMREGELFRDLDDEDLVTGDSPFADDRMAPAM